jgi:hypothetical protein
MFLATSVALFGWMVIAGERVLSSVITAGNGVPDAMYDKEDEDKDKTSVSAEQPGAKGRERKGEEIDKNGLVLTAGVDHYDD